MAISNLPATLGGPPTRPSGPPPWPTNDPRVGEALSRAFADGTWGAYHGPNVPRLETALRDYHGIEHVMLCGSGSFAIETALRSISLRPGDEVILADFDFPGNFLSIHAAGGMPVLADVDPIDWNLSLASLDEAVGQRPPRALIVSHLHGGVVPMSEVMAWAIARDIVVIEDACQCPGAVIDGKKAGTWGDIGVLSFGGSKLLTAGRGGALMTRRDDLHQRARSHQLRGNLLSPLSELQAAVLLPQLEQLDERNRHRARNAKRLREKLAGLPGVTPFGERSLGSEPGFYKVGFQFDAEAFGVSRPILVAAARAEGIALDESFAAAHAVRSPKRYRRASELTESKKAHAGCVVLHHPVLLEDESAIDEVAAALRKMHLHAGALSSLKAQGRPSLGFEPAV